MPRIRFLAADKSAEDSVSRALTAAKTGTLAGRGNDPVRQMLDFAARAIGHTVPLLSRAKGPRPDPRRRAARKRPADTDATTSEKIGYRKEFFKEILKEVRVKGNAVRLTYKLPMTELRHPKA